MNTQNVWGILILGKNQYSSSPIFLPGPVPARFQDVKSQIISLYLFINMTKMFIGFKSWSSFLINVNSLDKLFIKLKVKAKKRKGTRVHS